MPAAPIGLIANPASGKDIRRLVAHASVFDNAEKRNIVRRVILGAAAAGAGELLYMPDSHNLVASAAADLPVEVRCAALPMRAAGRAEDTTRAAELLREAGCGVVVTLGGDGTNRAAALGWCDLPLVPISTGTNNVFPRMLEGTVAGAAAGLIASGAVPLDRVASVAKRVVVQVDGEKDDLALIDAVLVAGSFAGARALWDVDALRMAVLARAEPAAVGISAVGGLLSPTGDTDDCGLCVEFGEGGCVMGAPVAPGLYRHIEIRLVRRLALDEPVCLTGPGLLAFDGERERRLGAGQRATLRVRRDGPRVVDVQASLAEAAHLGIFIRSPWPDAEQPEPSSEPEIRARAKSTR